MTRASALSNKRYLDTEHGGERRLLLSWAEVFDDSRVFPWPPKAG